MQPVTTVAEREVGALLWAGRDPRVVLQELKELGVRCGQIGVPGEMPLEGAATLWRDAIGAEAFVVTAMPVAYVGESYTDIPTVQQTVGFMPEATRAEREERTRAVSDFARELGVGSISCHVGFVPEDANDPHYVAVRDMVRRLCDHCQANGQTFALETGQEPATVLMEFIADVDRPNLVINFDPANMILYGTGDPIEALGIVASKVGSVHVKDGHWPPPNVPGALGTEVPLGQGDVGMERYVAKLKEIGYKNALVIEREVEDHQQRLHDMRQGVELLQGLRQ